MSFVLALVLSSCGGSAGVHQAPGSPSGELSDDGGAPDLALGPSGDNTPDDTPDSGAPALADLASVPLAIGGVARVTASSLNLRSGAGTMNGVVAVMKCGDSVRIVGGPDTYWWNVTWQGPGKPPGNPLTGWASGNYLVADSAFDPAICLGAPVTDGGVAPDGGMSVDQMSIFARARLAVGYSYYWGHGSWRSDGTQLGACMGSCGACSHTGPYGADCSGFVAKCWQVPTPSPLTTDLHPYSTVNFYNQTTHWSPLPRAQIKPADALVYNANGAGHIMLFESGADPWGNIWTFEARGCSTGVVHNLRVAPGSFNTIRREGL